MAHFIELNVDDEEQSPLCLNVDWIFCVEPNKPDRGSVVRFAIEKFIDSSRNAGTQIVTVIESYSTIKELLGC